MERQAKHQSSLVSVRRIYSPCSPFCRASMKKQSHQWASTPAASKGALDLGCQCFTEVAWESQLPREHYNLYCWGEDIAPLDLNLGAALLQLAHSPGISEWTVKVIDQQSCSLHCQSYCVWVGVGKLSVKGQIENCSGFVNLSVKATLLCPAIMKAVIGNM